MSLNLAEYHDSIEKWLKSEKTVNQWFNQVCCYPEAQTRLSSPFLFFSVEDWAPDSEERNDGKSAWSLNLMFYIGVPVLLSKRYQIDVRDLTMAMCTVLKGCRFGIAGSIQPMEVVSAQPDGFETELDDYEVWSINTTQVFLTGDENSHLLASSFTSVSQIFAGYSPDIGADYEADYEELYNETGE